MSVSARARQAVFERDRWQCKMPECLRPEAEGGRAIDPALAGTEDLWAPTIDHRVRRADKGSSKIGNLRAAHRACNMAAGRFTPPFEASGRSADGGSRPDVYVRLRQAERDSRVSAGLVP